MFDIMSVTIVAKMINIDNYLTLCDMKRRESMFMMINHSFILNVFDVKLGVAIAADRLADSETLRH